MQIFATSAKLGETSQKSINEVSQTYCVSSLTKLEYLKNCFVVQGFWTKDGLSPTFRWEYKNLMK